MALFPHKGEGFVYNGPILQDLSAKAGPNRSLRERAAMETNESILVRDVVGLDDRRVIGKMRELRVNCDNLAVSHYVVASATTTTPLVLPFDAALAVGDTFVTVQSREDFLSAGSTEAQELVADGFKLVGVDAFSRTGDKLGVVAGYEFDPVFGTITSLTLDNGTAFQAAEFVFFAPEFVFVDNGAKTAAELRVTAADAAEDAVLEAGADAPVAVVAEEEVVADAAPELSAEDAQLVELLVGTTLTNDVASEDGAFTVAKDTVLTREMVDDAIAHDALLLLTLAADL